MDPQELLYATSIYSCRWWSNHCSIEFRVSAYYVSRIADLEKDVQKLRNEKNMLVQKFEEASRGPVLFLLRNMLEIFFVLIIGWNVGGPSSLVAVPFYQCVGFFLRWQSETAINSGSLPLVPRKGKGKCQRDKETMRRCCSRIREQFPWLLSEMVAPEAF